MLPAAAGDALAVALAPLQEHLFDAFFAGRNPRTVAAYRQDLEDFRAFVAMRPELAALVPTAEDAAKLLLSLQHGVANALALAFRASMVERQLAPATVNRRLAALRSVVKLGNTLGLIAWKLDVENIASESYRDTRGPGREAVKEIKRLAGQRQDAKGVRDVAIVHLLHDVGGRRGEIVGLDLEHYDRRRGTIAVLGKGRNERQLLTLPPPTRVVLEAWIVQRGPAPGPLFHRLDSARRGGGRLSGEAVRLIVRDLGDAAGVRARPHGLRHTAITTVLDLKGGDVRAARLFARHRDVRTTLLYDDNRSDLAGQMAALITEE